MTGDGSGRKIQAFDAILVIIYSCLFLDGFSLSSTLPSMPGAPPPDTEDEGKKKESHVGWWMGCVFPLFFIFLGFALVFLGCFYHVFYWGFLEFSFNGQRITSSSKRIEKGGAGKWRPHWGLGSS
jgi:hypothetical protein